MRIDDSWNARAWQGPDDADVALLRPPAPAAAAPETAAEPPAAAPFWAAGTPLEPGALQDLHPADVTPPATAAAATTPPPAPAAAAYTGEPAVDPAWLQQREAALQAVRSDYEANRAAALATQGRGAGWVPAVVVTDESGRTSALNGDTLALVTDPGAQPVLVGWDEGAPVYAQPAGQWMAFDEAGYAAAYRAQGGAPLQALATLYGSDPATLLAAHPELWTLATTDHALNAGPPPPGQAMGDAQQLGMLDLYLADPQIAGLIAAYGGSAAPARSGIAPEQVRLYGEQRYDQLTRLSNAMQSVRDQYTGALAQAERQGSGPGWVDRAVVTTVRDESGATSTVPAYVTDESGRPMTGPDGEPIVVTEHVFDVDAYTAWYLEQPGLQHQAFADFYGRSHTTYATDESGRRFAAGSTFDNPNWSMAGVGAGMGHTALVSLDPNHPPELNDPNAVGFDLEAGWATAQGNIHQDRDWFETLAQIAIIAVVSYVSAGTLGAAASGAVGGGLAGAVASAAVVGASTSLASGMMSGNLTLRGIVQGALSGALSVGVVGSLGSALDITGTAGTIALRTTVQGGIQALMGGSFRDGALSALASGLAEAAGDSLKAGIDEALAAGTMSAAEGAAARMMARVLGSAIRAAGNPDDPAYGFASAFLDDVIRTAGTPDAVTAELPAEDLPGLAPALQAVADDPRTASGRLVTDETHDEALAEVNAEAGIDPEGGAVMVPAGWLGDAADSTAGYIGRLVKRVGGPLGDTVSKAMDLITIGRLSEAQQGIASYLNAAAARGGLSEVEIMALGVLYAANEALFPTTVLDVIPGAGKALGKVGDLIRAGGSAREVSAATRLESRAAASAERMAQGEAAVIEARAVQQGREVVRQQRGSSGDWNAALNGPLKADATYILDNGHAYHTDAAGRVTRAEGVLDLERIGDRNVYQQVKAGHIGGEGYDGGHLIASLFGGAGEKINLVPQLSTVNRGEFRDLEKSWADALRAGKPVKVEVSPVYGQAGSQVPTSLEVRYWIDGALKEVSFRNKPGG